MSSASLSTWTSVRTDRVKRLRAAHQALGGTGPGRRWVTDELNQGNADPGTLGSDFGLFGIALWVELQTRFQDRAKDWNQKLAALNMARNGIVHDDAAKVARVQGDGWPFTLRSVDRWKAALDGLARGMDHVVSGELKLVYRTSPW